MTTITILDGGMGRELELRGAPFRQPEWSALAMMEAPEIVKDVHKAFIAAGSRVITTNSYALVPFHIGEEVFKQRAAELAIESANVAKQAVVESGEDVKIAGSLAPLFGSYRADLYEAERAEEIARPLIKALAPHVDLWLNETQSLLAETLLMKKLVDELDSDKKPYWVSFTLEDSEPTPEPCLRSGETVVEAVKTMAAAGVDGILFNCCQPEIIADAIALTKQVLAEMNTELQIGAYANAFPPQPKNATANDGLDELRADLTPESYLVWAEKWCELGATLIGGCCGIGPDHIAALAKRL
ncbi:homocysteine S-methyltransferase family protein [Marinomonas ostreistagni]|uniref:Homocysteine S-methyltransferase family protein n=1 Tax=Marinomonas ostreistagni TaxID=359209 RepID=A0ABS0ZAB3_9GAMM|nr:homocysteine S-methyltransferase family protein [Marinomonas ostreistagni]MBJ7550587.1 homocysteine S-methyltransferase family protein [Marinomonas ostreistagni]